MTRDVKCTIINNTGTPINWDGTSTTETLQHGTPEHGPNNITNATTPQEAFKLKKRTGFDGVTGYIGYNLEDKSKLYLMFNNPYSHKGSGFKGNQWFYAVIQPPTSAYSLYYAHVSGAGIDPVSPESDDTLDVTVTIGRQPVQAYQALTPIADTLHGFQFVCKINNQNPNGAFLLYGLTKTVNNIEGIGSPPVKSGNPPLVAATIPNGQEVLAIQANGGFQMPSGNPEAMRSMPSATNPPTQGKATYITPGGYTLIINWNIQDSDNPDVTLGGTYPNLPAVGTPEKSEANAFTYTWTFK